MMNEQKKSIFFDKRDTQYIQLVSPIYFFEMFRKKKIKCDIQIPQTIIFSKGSPSLWLFNTKAHEPHNVLKKNSNKLNPVEVCRVLCKVKQSDEYRMETLTTLYEIVKHQKNEPAAFVRSSRLTKILNKQELVKMFLEGNISGTTTIQEYIVNHSRADEIYFIEYRQDVNTMPCSFRFFKKSTTLKQTTVAPPQNANPFNKLIYTTSSQEEDQDQVGFEQFDCMFKFFDSAMNATFQQLIRKIIDFLEKAYRVKVKKLVAKFVRNECGIIYFLGLKELLIEFTEKAVVDQQKVREELRDNNSFENFTLMLKMFSRAPEKKAFNIPETIYEDDKEISAKLYKKLIVQRCVGDFCEYIMVEKNQGTLQIRKNIVNDYRKYFGDKKMNEEKFSVSLPHEIAYQLILRTRECFTEVIELLKRNKIFNRESKHHIQEYDTFNAEEEYPFQFKKTEVFNLPTLYKNVKICKNCFVVYSLTSKYFDQRLQSDLQYKQWSTQQQRPCSSKQDLDKQQQEQQQQQQQQISYEDKIIKTQKSESRILSSKQERNIKSASHFRITKNTEPKTFKLFIPKPSASSQSRSTNVTQRNNIDQKVLNNNMEINRLTMGFLNYNKPPRPKTSQSHKIIKRAQTSKRLNESDSSRNAKSAKQLNQVSNRFSLFANRMKSMENIHILKKEYDLITVCDQLGVEYPPESIPDLQLEAVNYFAYKDCAIPYLILQNEDEDVGLDLSQTELGTQTILILGDFFDNIFEYLELCQSVISGNTKIILLNLPGQAYTIFNQSMDSLEIAQLIDSFLFELNSKDFFKGVDKFKFFGIGYGGFQILNYLAYSNNTLPNLDKIILINPFCEIDNMLRDTLVKSNEVFLTCPDDMQELNFHYWNSLISSQQQEYDPRLNPISNKGRMFIIDGCLQSQNLWQSSSIDVDLTIYHGLRNCLVNLQQAQQIKSRQNNEINKDINKRIQINFIDISHKIDNIQDYLAQFI